MLKGILISLSFQGVYDVASLSRSDLRQSTRECRLDKPRIYLFESSFRGSHTGGPKWTILSVLGAEAGPGAWTLLINSFSFRVK